MAEELHSEGIEVEMVQVGDKLIPRLHRLRLLLDLGGNYCVFKDDIVNETCKKMREADGFILSSPTYYAGINGAIKAFLDRVFFSSSVYFRYKVATSVAAVRRAGGVDVVHQLNNYLNLAETVGTVKKISQI